jgi:hypothetical protein
MNNTGKKYGGRTVGTPNKLTSEVRTLLKDLVYNEFANLQTTIQSLEGKERIEFLTKLLPYVLPKVKDVHHDINEPNQNSYENWLYDV